MVTLGDESCPAYLYFRREALKKYLDSENTFVNFHMQTWGFLYSAFGKVSVDVGINSKGLVTAFAPDLAKLPENEINYWSSFSTMPDGEI